MIDICYIEEFFHIIPLKELNKCSRVCKKWNQYLDNHPEVFWFKHEIKLGTYIRPCSCTFNELFWCIYQSGAIIGFRPSSYGRFTYNGDKIKLIDRYNIYNMFHRYY